MTTSPRLNASIMTPVLVAGCVILMLSFAIRASFGVFQIPVGSEFGWPRAEFSLAIENAVEGGKLFKEMVSAQGFIGSNLKALCENGRPAVTGRMVGVLSPIFGLLAKKKQGIENWPL